MTNSDNAADYGLTVEETTRPPGVKSVDPAASLLPGTPGNYERSNEIRSLALQTGV